MKLLVQPGDGVTPLVKAIDAAKISVEILIFRFDRGEIERALVNAAHRGVRVQALIAYTNRGGEKHLRDLEMRLLAAGVTVARTADDLVRYHGKFMIVDRCELYLLSFNFTYLDIEHSRSFGLITTNRKFVQEAIRLFEADTKRQPYRSTLPTFVVSPANARQQLAAFVKAAQRQLLIYDPKVADPAMIRLLEERAKAGIEIRIIGVLAKRSDKLPARKLGPMRLHTRAIIRDSRSVFLGSQSLRTAELDARREVGVIFSDPKIVARLIKLFHGDWKMSEQSSAPSEKEEGAPASKVAKRVAEAVTKGLPPVAPVVEVTVKEMGGAQMDVQLNTEELEETVKDAVKSAVKEVVKDAVEEVVEQSGR